MLRTILLAYAFYYPLTMAWLWIFGALNYYVRRELRAPNRTNPAKAACMAQGHAGGAVP